MLVHETACRSPVKVSGVSGHPSAQETDAALRCINVALHPPLGCVRSSVGLVKCKAPARFYIDPEVYVCLGEGDQVSETLQKNQALDKFAPFANEALARAQPVAPAGSKDRQVVVRRLVVGTSGQ